MGMCMSTGFRRTLLTGIVIALPLVVTFWVLDLAFSVIDGAITPVVMQVMSFIFVQEKHKYSREKCDV